MQNRKPDRAEHRKPHGQSSAAGAVPVTVALHQCIQRLQRSLNRKLSGLPRAVTPDTVHRTRTAARRLRAVLSAFRQELDPAAFHRYATALQEMIHDLNAVREADVTQKVVSSLSQKHAGPSRAEMDGLKAAVAHSRSRTVVDLESMLRSDAWSARLVELRYVASDPRLIVATQEPMRSAIERVLKRRRLHLLVALRYRGHEPRRLHKLRLKIKKQRYLLEECDSDRSGVTCAEIKQLCELQDCLGDLHDVWCVGRALKRQRRYRRAARDLSADIKHSQSALFHKFRKHRKELRRIWRAAKKTS